jgi:hypothetical protein
MKGGYEKSSRTIAVISMTSDTHPLSHLCYLYRRISFLAPHKRSTTNTICPSTTICPPDSTTICQPLTTFGSSCSAAALPSDVGCDQARLCSAASRRAVSLMMHRSHGLSPGGGGVSPSLCLSPPSCLMKAKVL